MRVSYEMEQAIEMNPYVAKVQRIADSLGQLSQAFKLEQYETPEMSELVIDDLIKEMEGYACASCSRIMECQIDSKVEKVQYVRELMACIDEYGEELQFSKKREFGAKCEQFPLIKRVVENEMKTMRKFQIWNEKIHRNKEASLVAVNAFASAIEEVTREVGESVFRDERLERKVIKCLKRRGIRVMNLLFLLKKEGSYEVHVCAKVKQGICVSVNEIAEIVSIAIQKKFVPELNERQALQESYENIILVEKPKFQVLCGCAKKEKDGSQMSGDNFLIMNVGRAKKLILLSDGMGSGEKAFAESRKALELAQELLEAGISPKRTVEMMNATLASESGELSFSTLDLCLVDLYKGVITMMKAGAAPTYIYTKQGDRKYAVSSLPLGIVTEMEVESYSRVMEDGDYVVMITDGLAAIDLPAKQESGIRTLIESKKTRNPEQLAREILGQVLSEQEGKAKDDMMVIVMGIWKMNER